MNLKNIALVVFSLLLLTAAVGIITYSRHEPVDPLANAVNESWITLASEEEAAAASSAAPPVTSQTADTTVPN
jgi:hypothetical protein